MWTKFWQWYEIHTVESLLVTAIIVYIQIPHMVWNADLYLQLGVISHVHPVLDFFLYGVDLIEIIPMINIAMLLYVKIKNGKQKN